MPAMLGSRPMTNAEKQKRYRARLYFRRLRGREAAEMEARREQAVTQSTAAKLVMTRRKAQDMREATVERDKSQAEIGSAARLLGDQLGKLERRLGKRVIEVIADDLGDLQAEAMRVTQIE